MGIKGNGYICMTHHSESIYDEGMWDAFIVQKNKVKRNRELKACGAKIHIA